MRVASGVLTADSDWGGGCVDDRDPENVERSASLVSETSAAAAFLDLLSQSSAEGEAGTLLSNSEKRTGGGVGGLAVLVVLCNSTTKSAAAIMVESEGLSGKSKLSVAVAPGEVDASESEPSGTGGRDVGKVALLLEGWGGAGASDGAAGFAAAA